MPLLARTWNLFHGNAVPPERRAFLREMVELVTADDPDIVCLQELPVWAVARLGGWSGMQAVAAIARRPRPLGRWLTELHHGTLRSAFTGEADAILVKRDLALAERREAAVSSSGLRRIAHGVRVGDRLFVANFHIGADEEQLRRVVEFVAGEERVVLAGDANLSSAGAPGFSAPLAGSIDQVLVRGLPATAPAAWPEERRRVGGRLLSDHAPVELLVG
ncbi:MAG TPA: endonuclease/exonuclease/phosphatase family protein [Gaiellaceae bacterium]|nr:endonuclease/exonuclease/phosphatase family protein [Gaiellaceae bacterium]